MEQTAIATPRGSDSPKKAKPRRRRNWLPFWLILPTVLVLLAIQVYPVFYTLVLSVQQRQPTGWEFVGLQNFEILLGSRSLGESAGHTLIFLVGYASLTLTLAFAIALLLNRKSRLSGVYITLLFIPWILADIIAGVVFRLLVLPDYGLFSGILQNPAYFPPNGLSILTADAARPWFGDFPFPPSPAMIYLILAATWRALPFITLLLLAALQTVSNEVIESSRIDGANGWQTITPHHDPADPADHGGGALQPHARRHQRRRHGLQPDRRRAGHLDHGAQLSALLHRLGIAGLRPERPRWL